MITYGADTRLVRYLNTLRTVGQQREEGLCQAAWEGGGYLSIDTRVRFVRVESQDN